jgi:membrane protease YdiL (CAAX protease family)
MMEVDRTGSPTAEERLLTIAMLLFIAITPLLPPGGRVTTSVFLGVLTIWAVARKHVFAAAAGTLFVIFFAAVELQLRPGQVAFAVAICGYGMLARWSPWFRRAASWVKRGEIDARVVALSTGFVVLAGSALLFWFYLFKPNLKDIVEGFVPDVSLPLLICGAVAFAMVNALVEEIAYRGVLMEGLHRGTGSLAFAVVGQAVAFGTLHIHGFPRGVVGVGLAIIYGLMMGVLRIRSRGMLAPWLAHVLTDGIIFAIVLFLVR